MNKTKLKTGDKVRVIAGANKNSEGTILKISKNRERATVEGVNMVSKHEKPSATNPQGGIKEMEAPLHISNLSLIDSDGKTSRAGYRMDDGKKVRFTKTNNQAI